jgi:hypothetical protein
MPLILQAYSLFQDHVMFVSFDSKTVCFIGTAYHSERPEFTPNLMGFLLLDL